MCYNDIIKENESENNIISKSDIIGESERLSSSTPGAISLRSIAPVQVSLRENSHVQHKSFWIVRNVAEGLCNARPDNLHAGSATSHVKRLKNKDCERRKEGYCYPQKGGSG